MLALNFSIAFTAFYVEEAEDIVDGEEPGTSWCCCYKLNTNETYSPELSFYYNDAMSPFFESSTTVQYKSSIKDALSLIFLGGEEWHQCDDQCKAAMGSEWTSCGNIKPCVSTEILWNWPYDYRCDRRCYQEGGGYEAKQCSKGRPER